LEVKTLLNRIQHFTGFVYQDIRLGNPSDKLCLDPSSTVKWNPGAKFS
jgi:hypothetical protein